VQAGSWNVSFESEHLRVANGNLREANDVDTVEGPSSATEPSGDPGSQHLALLSYNADGHYSEKLDLTGNERALEGPLLAGYAQGGKPALLGSGPCALLAAVKADKK
jgi:hypothetical protein